jgi:hypothetical protein
MYADPSADRGILRVPVRVHAPGVMTILTGLLPSGERVGLGFTTPNRLAAVFGPGHASVPLHLRALRGLLAPCGLTEVQVDPAPARNGRTPAPSAAIRS